MSIIRCVKTSPVSLVNSVNKTSDISAANLQKNYVEERIWGDIGRTDC